MDLTAILRTFNPKTEYTFFSSSHGIFSRIDQILDHKTIINKFKKVRVIPCIFSNHNGIKLEFNHEKKLGNNTNT